MTATKSLSERLRLMAENLWDVESKTILEAADALDEMEAEIERLRAALEDLALSALERTEDLDQKDAEIATILALLKQAYFELFEHLHPDTSNQIKAVIAKVTEEAP